MGHRTDEPVWNSVPRGGRYRTIWGAVNLNEEVSHDMGYHSDSIAISHDLGPLSKRGCQCSPFSDKPYGEFHGCRIIHMLAWSGLWGRECYEAEISKDKRFFTEMKGIKNLLLGLLLMGCFQVIFSRGKLPIKQFGATPPPHHGGKRPL